MHIDNYNAHKGRGMSGKRHSPESIAKMRKSSLGQVPWNKGKKMSDSTRAKMSQISKGNKNMLGKIHSPETRAKISASRLGKATGINHPHWKGGTSKNQDVSNARRKERLRLAGGFHTEHEWELLKIQYNNTCPACMDKSKKLTKDHIIPISKGGSNNIENIQPLCKRCNSKKHTITHKY